MMIFDPTPFLTGFALSAALIIAIGAQNLFVLRQGLRREHVGPIVLFCAAADALLISAGVAGIGTMLGALPVLTLALTLGGAAFLGWYGVKALRRVTVSDAMIVQAGEGLTLGRALAAAVGFTLLNPHVYLDTVLLMGTAGAAQPADVRPFFVAGAIAASFLWFTSLGYGARILAPLFARPVAWRVLDGLVGVTMLVLAGSLLLRAFLQEPA
ncbi:LysE/ArgO family amino acid transporter [Niveispirillum irakense]|uniref:LysE/ArgO family amino acid transporter n=1 Tax=Niveispirillum irakense TaxID=34011 RepID=UPI0003FF5882|nr:LysE/ArgO family amino acid transporter [Niveispirillum irakense]